MFQTMKLLERKYNHFNKTYIIEDNPNARNEYYEPKFNDVIGIEDKQSRIFLSSLAYTK